MSINIRIISILLLILFLVLILVIINNKKNIENFASNNTDPNPWTTPKEELAQSKAGLNDVQKSEVKNMINSLPYYPFLLFLKSNWHTNRLPKIIHTFTFNPPLRNYIKI
jgi:hypothetical protein